MESKEGWLEPLNYNGVACSTKDHNEQSDFHTIGLPLFRRDHQTYRKKVGAGDGMGGRGESIDRLLYRARRHAVPFWFEPALTLVNSMQVGKLRRKGLEDLGCWAKGYGTSLQPWPDILRGLLRRADPLSSLITEPENLLP